MKNKYKLNQKGFSLIEIMVSLTIFLLVGVAIWSFQRNIFMLNDFIANDLDIQKEARKTFKQISSEIRSISQSSTGAYPIEVASPNSFIFYSDIDNDAIQERIHYFLSGNTLKKGVTKPSGAPLTYDTDNEVVIEVIHNIIVGTPIFSYYDAEYDGTKPALTDPIDLLAIRLAKISITTDVDPNRPSAPFSITTQVSMRNLKDNL